MLIEDGYTRALDFDLMFNRKPEFIADKYRKLVLLAWEGEGDTNWVYDEKSGDLNQISDIDCLLSLITFIGELVPGLRWLCEVYADVSPLLASIKPSRRSGVQAWILECKLRIALGGAQIKAHVEWYEGVCKFYSLTRS